MDWRHEARIGCSIMMIGTALATMSSVTGLGLVGKADVGLTLVMGVLVLAMVMAAGNVLVNGTRRASGLAALAGMAGAAGGWFLGGHQFLWAFPGIFAAMSLLSAAFARRPGKRAR